MLEFGVLIGQIRHSFKIKIKTIKKNQFMIMKKKMNLFSSKKQKFTQKIVDGLMNKKCSEIFVKFEMDGLSMPVGGSNHSKIDGHFQSN